LKQIEHLEWAVRPASERSPKKFRVKKPKTEGEAAEMIAKLTEKVFAEARARREGTAPLPGVADVTKAAAVPAAPRRARATKAATKAKKRTRRRTRTKR
jgi:hypothetical protein